MAKFKEDAKRARYRASKTRATNKYRRSKMPISKQMERAIVDRRANLQMGFATFDDDTKDGRKGYTPTEGDQIFIRKLTSYGLTVDEIATCINGRYGQCGVTPDVIRRHFKQELADGRQLAIILCAGKLFDKVRKGNLGAIIFYLKTQGRWSSQVNLADPQGNPLQPPTVHVMFGAEDDDDNTNVIEHESHDNTGE
jgi:hypothetical protein